jgi:hypothetical protein
MNRTTLLCGLCLLTACGAKGPLSRPTGATPIPASYGAAAPLSTDQLLTPPPQTEPSRADDPVRRSKPRADDKFDLPPPG